MYVWVVARATITSKTKIHSKKFQKTLILAFEPNAVPTSNYSFYRVLAHSAGGKRLSLIWNVLGLASVHLEKVAMDFMTKSSTLGTLGVFKFHSVITCHSQTTIPNTYHSSEIRGLCLMKWPSETLQNLTYFVYVAFSVFKFMQLYLFPNECPAQQAAS